MAISCVFPQSTNERKDVKDPAKDPQYSELLIDAMRAEKDQVLGLHINLNKHAFKTF